MCERRLQTVTGDSVRGGVFIKVMPADLMPELRTVVVILYFGKELIQLYQFNIGKQL